MIHSRKSSLSALTALLPAVAFAVAACPLALQAQTEILLHSFGANPWTDAINPEMDLVRDAKGNLYGTSGGGTNSGAGTVFQLTPTADHGWTEEVLYNFGATVTDGSGPYASLILDAKGNLYGTTLYGGTNGSLKGDGTAFELTPTAGGGWTEKVLFNFGATGTDGTYPQTDLIFDAQGNLYGTTNKGGTNGDGTAFELTPGTDGGWTEKVLYNFGATGTDGINPTASLVFDANGNLYSTTYKGGLHNAGAAFELTPGTNGAWTEKVIYDFGATATDGQTPFARLIFDAAKVNLYGMTEYGGANDIGTAFELTPATDGEWTEKVLHDFGASRVDGGWPLAGLLLDAQGNFYGTTALGGTNDQGTVFELTPGENGDWTETILHNFNFQNGVDGISPYGGLISDGAGNLYGTTEIGGAYGNGSAFQIVTSSVQPAIVLTPTSLPSATVATAYRQTLTAAGGTSPYTYAITSGALPSGLALSASGEISGTASAASAASFTVTATDSSVWPGPYTGSQAYTLTVVLAPDFTVTANPATLTIAAGQSGTAVFTVTPSNGFTQSVQMTCTGLPANSTCSFSPGTLTPAGAPVTSTLTIATNVKTASLAKPQGSSSAFLAGIFFPGAIGTGLLLWLFRRKASHFRRAMVLGTILIAASIATGAFMTGCGGSASGGTTTPITPAGKSTVTVTAASSGVGGASHVATLAVTITN